MRQTSGVIYNLNDTEYDRLPPLFKLDDYYPCLRGPGDQYCYVDAKLVTNGSRELLHVIQEYSAANNFTHYDHNLIHWGICVTKTCRQYLGNHTVHEALEACINSSLQQTHQLQARLVEEKVYCTAFEETDNIDTGDIVVAVILITILTLNVLGTLYDVCCVSKSVGGRFLLCFSAKRNWRRLFAPSGEGSEPRLSRLKLFNGINIFILQTYYDPIFHIFYNGNLIVQTFFVLSGCLLAFNLLLGEEKTRLTWPKFPRYVMLRWMRLTPPYAAVLAVIATWMKRFGDGPMWKPVVGVETEACRRDWFYHLLYLNDYVDHSQCMAHTWYLAVDMKLTILGLLVFCLVKSWRARKIAIGVAFVAGVVAPAVCTYLQNLNAIHIVSPEVARNYFVEDPTFNNLYKRTHTNIVCYAMGLALGMWIYKRMQTDVDINKYKKYRPVYWATVPIGVFLCALGGIFYIDGIQVPMLARVLYTPGVKLLFGLLALVLIPGTIFKLDTVYRGFLEWQGWAVLGRVSYCAYIVHVAVIRVTTANHATLLHTNFLQILLTYFAHLITSFVIALPCWMMIEAPFNQLVKLCFYPAPKDEPQEDTLKTIPREVTLKNIPRDIDTKDVKPVFMVNNKEKDFDGTVVLKL
ncbi:nose resistant to fluoxetine protein 6-like [Cydia splendana]|uniref:nose resistant to fluoxetine protein 6-like n=1 Tax=Cydia splendana TaxID=1100963 RepID=UPI00300C2064